MSDLISRQCIKVLRDTLVLEQQILDVHYKQTHNAQALLRGRSRLIDQTLDKLWALLPDYNQNNWALIAVGGYGRQDLFLASDIDLLILLPESCDADGEAVVSMLVSALWDIGLEAGHSVRTINECMAQQVADITIQTSLLESRFLVGNYTLYALFHKTFIEALDPASFYQAKRIEQAERYGRYEDSIANLEPNCKESPGGLRDLQLVIWIAKAAKFGSSFVELAERGLMTYDELRDIERSQRTLQHLRLGLHRLLKRREDRLLFEHQTIIARQYGFKGSAQKRPSEQLMQRYYRTAGLVMQLSNIIIQNMGERIFPERASAVEYINDHFQLRWQLLDISDDQVFIKTPTAILECFALLQNHKQIHALSARTFRALWRARTTINSSFRNNPQHRQQFLQLLKHPHAVLHEFQRLNQIGILGRYLPAWGRIVGQMQHDLFHIYTVDQHSLMVLRNLRRFADERFVHEFAHCSQLIATFEQPWILYTAALFHDIAKGRGGDHSKLGKIDAERFCRDHGVAPADSDFISFLVEHHLLMSQVAQKSDITDPQVIGRFAGIVVNEQRLTALYLLTVADIRGTSPKVWNQWKGRLLADLYAHTLNYFNQDGVPAKESIVSQRQAEAMRHLRFFALSNTVQKQLWQQLDAVYFLRHSAEEIAWHTRALYYRIHNDQPVVCARLFESTDLQVMVYAQNMPGLFVRLVSFFVNIGYNILEARIHTTAHEFALDSFILSGYHRDDISRERIAYIEHELPIYLQKKGADTPPATGYLSRWVKHFPITPEISLQVDVKGQHYILEINASDRRGLLYIIAKIMDRHHVNLHTAKIATLGERVEDVFLVSGDALHTVQGRVQFETDLAAALN